MLLVDAGPLAALFRKNDARHADCVKVLKSLREPLFTIWPVITEAMYLLSESWPAQEALWDMILAGNVVLLPLDPADSGRMKELMAKYKDVPMDLADAGLVCVAGREKAAKIFTIDGDFRIYRPHKGGHFTIVP